MHHNQNPKVITNVRTYFRSSVFFSEKKQFLYPDYRKQYDYQNHKPSNEYAFYLKHICLCSTQITQAFLWVWIWFEHIWTPLTQPTHTLHHIQTHLRTRTNMHTYSYAHTYTYKLTYAQPSPYINTFSNLNMHTHIITCTHIKVKTQ